ncbi:MAG TPA: thiamine pyrophosphate-dependent enzyme, partial [Candidatus Omnitrophota bacterium]|nr:thiamine pyrophosphate-dependent enzyme [Candidatus Omnitrophota bacterium]
NAALYRAPEELQAGYQRDPIKEFVEHVLTAGILKEQEIAQISSRVDGEVEEAFVFAQNSPLPDGGDLAKFLFVD